MVPHGHRVEQKTGVMKTTLQDLGFDGVFEKHLAACSPRPGLEPARVTAVNRNNFNIRNETSEVVAEATGKLMYDAESRLDLPVTGDWVLAEYFGGGNTAIVHSVLPRKSLLSRKTAGLEVDYQPIAANIDIAFVVQALDHDFNPRRLERYLAVVSNSGIRPVILLSKTDLVSPGEADGKVEAVRRTSPGYDVIRFSNRSGEGVGEIRGLIRGGETCCLLGSSGVGKTTLLNGMMGGDMFSTAEVRSKDGKGRHVTTRRQLTVLEGGGLIIDTPGMRELGAIGINGGLEETFPDISSLTGGCRFRDCTHTSEPGCAVLEAVESGDVSGERYRSYLKLRRESEYHEMSLADKRRKDKQFGKMVKRVMKHHKKR